MPNHVTVKYLNIGSVQWRNFDLKSGGTKFEGAEDRDAGGVEGGWEWGEGIPLPSRLGGLGERRELPQRGPGRSPGGKSF